jgi:glycosyltransferase involved in cell wall biosynthesis
MLSQDRLRAIAWEVGSKYPIPLTANYIALTMVRPHQGHLHWHVNADALDKIRAGEDERFKTAPLIIRLYDVTDIMFDGLNAHSFFDISINHLAGGHYFNVPRVTRHYLAEIGLRAWDGAFCYVARSTVTYFDPDRPTGNYQVSGLYVGRGKRKFPIDNIFDAKLYEQMNRELLGVERTEALAVGTLLIGLSRDATPLSGLIQNLAQRLAKFGAEARLFRPTLLETKAESLLADVETISKTAADELIKSHRQKPLHLIHAHDWYSAKAGLKAAQELKLPLVLSLHSTEYERSQGYTDHPLSAAICAWEKEGVQGAALVIVPYSSTRQQVISLYEAAPEKVVIQADIFDGGPGGFLPDPTELRSRFGLGPDDKVGLFAGDLSHATGADLLVAALPQVCGRYGNARFIFVGEGPLKGELEASAWHNGVGDRCRFLGDVSRERFEEALLASDFVVIPARTWQDQGLAQTAIDAGRPVLTTHQAGINCVRHGENGLITYDNPGSIIWGVQEMIANPMQGSMLRLVAKKQAGQKPSLENITAQQYTYYEIALKNYQGGPDHG